jgi:hypothetical protein
LNALPGDWSIYLVPDRSGLAQRRRLLPSPLLSMVPMIDKAKAKHLRDQAVRLVS